MGFGKYSSLTLKSVIDSDPSYIDWCLRNIISFSLDAEATVYACRMIPGFCGGVANCEDETDSEDEENGGDWCRVDDSEDYDSFADPNDDYDIDYTYYNDQLDPDQQDKEFWDQF